MAEIRICNDSKLSGKLLDGVLAEQKLNLLIVAIKRDNQFLSSRLEKESIKNGDILLVIGQPTPIQKLVKLATFPGT